MKRKPLFFIFFGLFISLTIINNDHKAKVFFSFFPKKTIPYLTKEIGTEFYYEKNGYQLLPDSLVIKYIYSGETDNLYYSYIQRHMEDPTYSKVIKQKYDYYAVGLIEYEKFNLILFPKENNIIKKLYGYTFNPEGEIIDSIVLNEYKSELYYDTLSFQYSLIKNDCIIIFCYKNLIDPNMRNENDYLMKDKVKNLIKIYSITENGNINLEKTDSYYLKEEINKYENKNGKLIEDDPLKKYLFDIEN